MFSRVKVTRNGALSELGARALDNAPPARHYEDYAVEVDSAGLPDGIELLELV